MTTGKLIYIIVMGWTLIIIGGIAYLFKKKRDFSLLSGFSNRPEVEKQYLEENGYLTAVANVIATSFWLFLITFIAGLLPIPFAFEISINISIIYMMIGMIWVQRYEVPHKRKKMFWITSLISAGTIIFVVTIFSIGFGGNSIIINEETLEISGMYGDEWPLEEIEKVELLDELPEVLMRTNGYSMSGVLKGNFKLEEPYGKGMLFIDGKEGPYLAVFTEEKYIIINRKDQSDTLKLYEKLLENIN